MLKSVSVWDWEGQRERLADAVLPGELIIMAGMGRTESRDRNGPKENRQTQRRGSRSGRASS